MKTIFRNTLAVMLGIVVGGVLNMVIVMVSPIVIPPPPGVDVTNQESLKASIHLFEPKHFLFPFLAHALGTLVGALVVYVIAGSRRTIFALVVGVFYLVGGIAACLMIPAPTWFKVVDLNVAYIPMAWLGAGIGRGIVGGVKTAKQGSRALPRRE